MIEHISNVRFGWLEDTDFNPFLNLRHGRHLRPGGTVSQILGAENLKGVLPKLVDTLGLKQFRLLTNLVLFHFKVIS